MINIYDRALHHLVIIDFHLGLLDSIAHFSSVLESVTISPIIRNNDLFANGTVCVLYWIVLTTHQVLHNLAEPVEALMESVNVARMHHLLSVSLCKFLHFYCL